MMNTSRGDGPTVLVALLVSATALVFAPIREAEAFPKAENNCSDDTITFYFDDTGSGGAWASWQEDAATNGILDWNVVLDWDGGKVVNSLYEVSGPGGGAVNVELDTSPAGNTNALGSSECQGGATVSLNPTHLTSSSKMEHTARHEIGHLLGLEHTGDDDSFGGPAPTMATCGANPGTTSSLSQDDYGNITHKKGDLDPEIIHANASFEQGTSFWGTSGVSSFYTSTSSPEDGGAALRWRPSYSYGFVYQTMNYAAAGGTYIDARTNHRKLYYSATTGVVQLEILARQVTYASNPSCSYPTGKNQNTRTYVGPWYTVRTQTASPTSSWATLTESTLYTVPSSWDAADIRIRVKSNVTYTGGGFASLGLDTTRARDRS